CARRASAPTSSRPSCGRTRSGSSRRAAASTWRSRHPSTSARSSRATRCCAASRRAWIPRRGSLRPTLVLDVVGLTPALLGEHTPHLAKLARRGGMRPLATVTPAVTCTVQSTLLTGLLPREHGIVANGWYFRELSEIWFWRQSNRLVAG